MMSWPLRTCPLIASPQSAGTSTAASRRHAVKGPDRPAGLGKRSGVSTEPCPLGRPARRAPDPRPAAGGDWHSPGGGPLGTQALNSALRSLGTLTPSCPLRQTERHPGDSGRSQTAPMWGVHTALNTALRAPAGRSPRVRLQGEKQMPAPAPLMRPSPTSLGGGIATGQPLCLQLSEPRGLSRDHGGWTATPSCSG